MLETSPCVLLMAKPSGLSASAMLVGTDADKTVYVAPSGKFLGKSALVLGIKYTF